MSPLCLIALAAWTAAADVPPPDPKASALAAELAVAAGRYDEAAVDSQAALAAGYETPALRLVRAQAFWRAGRPADALAEADRALALNPDSAQGRLWRARALLALGRDAEGLDDLRRAAAMDRSLQGEYQAELARRAPARRPWWPWALAAAAAAGAAALVRRRRRGARLVRFGALIKMPSSADELAAGSVLAGRWVVGRLVERGAWGQRYEGRDLEDRPVSLRRFAPSAGGPRAFRAKTAQAAAALRHPGLLPLEAAFEQGTWAVAVGPAAAPPTLAETLKRRGGRLAMESLAGAAPVCDALEAAHAAGLVHGSITTRALRVGEDGWVLEGVGLPPAGEPGPQPPEGSAATAQADVYALACALYEAYAGKPPFASDSERREGRPAAFKRAGAAAGLQAFFTRALQPDPARRYRSAAELKVALVSAVSPAVH